MGLVGCFLFALYCGLDFWVMPPTAFLARPHLWLQQLARHGHEVTVFEKEGYAGGRMATRVKEGFPFDIGVDHLCKLYDETKKYCREFGIEWEQMRFLK